MKLGNAKGYIKKVELPQLIRAQTADDRKPVPIAAFECRGLEPKRWIPTGPYCVETE